MVRNGLKCEGECGGTAFVASPSTRWRSDKRPRPAPSRCTAGRAPPPRAHAPLPTLPSQRRRCTRRVAMGSEDGGGGDSGSRPSNTSKQVVESVDDEASGDDGESHPDNMFAALQEKMQWSSESDKEGGGGFPALVQRLLPRSIFAQLDWKAFLSHGDLNLHKLGEDAVQELVKTINEELLSVADLGDDPHLREKLEKHRFNLTTAVALAAFAFWVYNDPDSGFHIETTDGSECWIMSETFTRAAFSHMVALTITHVDNRTRGWVSVTPLSFRVVVSDAYVDNPMHDNTARFLRMRTETLGTLVVYPRGLPHKRIGEQTFNYSDLGADEDRDVVVTVTCGDHGEVRAHIRGSCRELVDRGASGKKTGDSAQPTSTSSSDGGLLPNDAYRYSSNEAPAGSSSHFKLRILLLEGLEVFAQALLSIIRGEDTFVSFAPLRATEAAAAAAEAGERSRLEHLEQSVTAPAAEAGKRSRQEHLKNTAAAAAAELGKPPPREDKSTEHVQDLGNENEKQQERDSVADRREDRGRGDSSEEGAELRKVPEGDGKTSRGSPAMPSTEASRQKEAREGVAREMKNTADAGGSVGDVAQLLTKLIEAETPQWDELAAIVEVERLHFRRAEPILFLSNKDTDTQVGVWLEGKSVIVAFRGTEEWKDFITDSLVMLYPFDAGSKGNIHPDVNKIDKAERQHAERERPCVHYGFLRAYASVRKALLDTVKILTDQGSEDYHLLLTGHSLGGALAAIMAADVRVLLPDMPATVYSFGAPKAGNVQFASQCNSLVPDSFRIVNNIDAITRMPMRGMLYFHSGRTCLLRENGAYWTCQPGKRFEASLQMANDMLEKELRSMKSLATGGMITDHMEQAYYKTLIRIQSNLSQGQTADLLV